MALFFVQTLITHRQGSFVLPSRYGIGKRDTVLAKIETRFDRIPLHPHFCAQLYTELLQPCLAP